MRQATPLTRRLHVPGDSRIKLEDITVGIRAWHDCGAHAPFVTGSSTIWYVRTISVASRINCTIT